MMKIVLKVELYDDKMKQKAMRTVSGISGVESVSVDMKDNKLTLAGDIDPVNVVSKLRKWCHTEIVSVGPAKAEKKDEPKPDEKNDLVKFYEAYPHYYHMTMRPPQYHCVRSVEEDPIGCVIC